MFYYSVRTVCTFIVHEAVPAPYDIDEIKAVEALGEEIVVLSAHLDAGTHKLLTLVAEFDRMGGWEPGGHRTCAHWLAFSTGIDLGAAREKVRAARALAELPGTSAAMQKGELSFTKVRALTRVATAENEEDLLELARGCTAAQLERMARAWKTSTRQDEAERERELYRSRKLSVFPDEEGMYLVRGRLTAEQGALLMRAIEAAGDALYTGQKTRQTSRNVSAETSVGDSARRRADAMGLVAERALAAGFGLGDPDGSDRKSSARPPLSGTRSERYQVMLHVDADTLSADREPGRSELEDGTRVCAESSRRLACDASVVEISHGPDGSVLGVGRKTRTIPPSLRRALEVRDRGCRFPGCGLRFTDAHHVKHWADGGETTFDNLLLLCSFHHRLVHEEDWTIDWWGEGRPVFVDRWGRLHTDGKKAPAPELPLDPVAALIEDTRRRGAEPDAWTSTPRWKREADIPDDVYFRAMEALGETLG